MAKQRQPDPCPKCYLEDNGRIEPLLSPGLGGQDVHTCKRGHSYPDRDELVTLLNQTYKLIQASKPPETQPPPKESKPEPKKDVPTGENEQSIEINPVDYIRLNTILGDFRDSSSLVGAVFSLNQQLLDARELLQRAEAAKTVGKIRKVGGDISVEVSLPERHVEPIKDIAEANNMSVERYMNAMVEHGLDNGWFS